MKHVVDFSGVCIGSIVDVVSQANVSVDTGLVKHIFLAVLTATFKKHRPSEVVIAVDSRHYWRKEVFKYYKHSRKKMREESSINWEAVFDAMETLKKDLKENFPYKVLEVYGAEADDIIAVLTRSVYADWQIDSEDKDFIQLHSPRVRQWGTKKKAFIKPECSQKEYYITHILKGDAGDGIPNIYMPDDFFVTAETASPKPRQKAISKKLIAEVMEKGFSIIPEEFQKNIERNQLLIDLKNQPVQLAVDIIDAYNTTVPVEGNVYKYFVDNKLVQLLDDINYLVPVKESNNELPF